MSKDSPAANVRVVMYASTDGTEVSCKTPSPDFEEDKTLGYPICEDITTEDGEFTFSSIPCGQYHVVPRWVLFNDAEQMERHWRVWVVCEVVSIPLWLCSALP